MSDDYDYSYRQSTKEAIDARREANNAIWQIDPTAMNQADFVQMQKIALLAGEDDLRALEELVKRTDRIMELSAEKESLLKYLVELMDWIADGCRDDQRPSCPDWIGD